MITASEARARVKQENDTKYYLELLDTKIKSASDKGKDSITMEWTDRVNRKVFAEVVQALVDNGYYVKVIYASHYYEYGAIQIAWR